jgi:molybdopterin molybdotransferase
MRVPLDEAPGCTLAVDARADRDLPPFDRAMMDGYAVRPGDLSSGDRFRVTGDIAAGAPPRVHVPEGACVRIATGAAVPDGLDAVIPHEESDRANPVSFKNHSVSPGQAIHRRGADARAGDIVVMAGTVLAPHHLGILASIGSTSVEVARPPRAVILTSGDEVRPIEESSIEPHHIRNSNAPLLAALIPRLGARFVRAEHLPDDAGTTVHAVARAIEEADLVITVGGVSAGERDFFPAAFDAAGVEMAVRGARLQPGRPIQIGRAPGGTIIVALPGNPVSALVTAHLFIWPIIRAMTSPAGSPLPVERGLGVRGILPWRALALAAPAKPNPSRQAFRPAILNDADTITIPKWSGSGDLVHTAPTHGIAALPEQASDVPAGAIVPFLAWA